MSFSVNLSRLMIQCVHQMRFDVVPVARFAAAAVFVSWLVLGGPVSLAHPVPESPTNEIGYPTVADALAALRSQPGVQISQQRGWTIVTNEATRTVWSFTPFEHPAHPSAVKRSVVSRGGSTYIDMKVLCEAGKAACDQLVTDFDQLNQRVKPPSPAMPQEPPVALSEHAPNGDTINVTSDSAPGWLPSPDQRAQVPRTTQEFLSALDGGQYQKAFGLMTPSQRALESFDHFSKRVSAFNAEAGAAKDRRILKITWTKDPAYAPSPGIYAAVDLTRRFERIDRHCGYIVLYQPDAASPFLVIRQEDNFITNESAHQIELQQSSQALQDIWAKLSKNCSNDGAR